MIFSRACEYGIRAAIFVAQHSDERYVPIREISQKLGISFHFLTKIFQQLNGAGLVDSYRGVRGGVRLTRPASDISLKDIVVALDGHGLFSECLLGLPDCGNDAPCPLHSQWEHQRTKLDDLLSSNSLADTTREVVAKGLRIGRLPGTSAPN